MSEIELKFSDSDSENADVTESVETTEGETVVDDDSESAVDEPEKDSVEEDPSVCVSFSCQQDFGNESIGNAGYDLRSAVDVVIPSRSRVLVRTTLKLEMPNTMYAQVKSRSGLSLKRSIDACGGVIDSNYRDFVGVILHNHSSVDFSVAVGDRIAQLIFLPVIHPVFQRVEESALSDSDRGTRGFGSSGVK